MRFICIIENLSQGGAERQLIGLACALKGQGHDVEVITYHSDCFYKYLLEANDVKHTYISKAHNKILRIPVICKYIHAFRPNVVISFLDTSCIIACIAKLLFGNFKLIVSERNTTQSLNFSGKVKFLLYRAADAIVPNSFSQTNFIKKNYPGLGNKTYTITNFVDTELFVPALSDGIGVDDNLTKIICVGRVCVQKNVLRFISAIKKVVESGIRIKVDWYGYKGIDLTYFNQCETLVRKEDLGDVFEFHDAITNIADMYPQYNVFCLPSIYEGYPNVVCEAMSCGLPILCSDVCDNGRIVRGDVNGYLFDPLSVDSIANTIIKFAKLPSEKKKNMQIKSREFSVSDFSYNTFVDKYLKLIAKC